MTTVNQVCQLSEAEIYYYNQLEKEWRYSQPRNSFYTLIEIYPAAISIIKRQLKDQIKKCKDDLKKSYEIENHWRPIINSAPPQDKWFYSLVAFVLYIEPLRENREKNREKIIKRNIFYLRYLNKKDRENTSPDSITELDIQAAKDVPIEHLYCGQLRRFGGCATGPCPFHNERNASFTIYLNQNKFYCFGCQAGTDAIDFVQKRDNCDFIKAVKTLVNK